MPLVTHKVKAKNAKGDTVTFDVNGAAKTTEELKAHCQSLGLTLVEADAPAPAPEQE